MIMFHERNELFMKTNNAKKTECVGLERNYLVVNRDHIIIRPKLYRKIAFSLRKDKLTCQDMLGLSLLLLLILRFCS